MSNKILKTFKSKKKYLYSWIYAHKKNLFLCSNIFLKIKIYNHTCLSSYLSIKCLKLRKVAKINIYMYVKSYLYSYKKSIFML